jgi:hypothetical protein
MSFDDDQLTQLLRRADNAAQQPARVTGLATRVRKRRARRRQVRVGAASIAAFFALAVLGWQLIDGRRAQERPIASGEPARAELISVAAVQDTIDSLARECELREAAVARMLASERRRAGTAQPTADVSLDLAWQREQAALTLVRQGDRLAQDLDLPKSAAVAYRQARDTFPGTSWGAIAEARLGGNESIH